LLRCSVATLFRSWLASLAVGLRTLASQVRAQRHSRIACYIVFRHRKIMRKKEFASFFFSFVVSELAHFARGRIEDSSLTGSRSTGFQNCLPHCFSWSPFFYFLQNQFFFLKISAIGRIESRTKFQNSLIFIFRVMVILVSFL